MPAPQPEKPTTKNGLPPGFQNMGDLEKVDRPDTFKLPGAIGNFLNEQQQYKLSILLTGDPHAGKTQVAYRLVDAFAEKGFKVGVLDLEQGGLESKDTVLTIERNVRPTNRDKIAVRGELESFEQLKEFASYFDVIMIDSMMELGIQPQRLAELRNEYPGTIFIIIGQENSKGTTYGGQTSDYIANVVFRVHKVDATFRNNYAEIEKNRGNPIGERYYFVTDRYESREEVEARKMQEAE